MNHSCENTSLQSVSMENLQFRPTVWAHWVRPVHHFPSSSQHHVTAHRAIGAFSPLSVLTPSKIGCSVSLSGPTGSPLPPRFMFCIISTEVLVTLKALLPNTGVLSIITVYQNRSGQSGSLWLDILHNT